MFPLLGSAALFGAMIGLFINPEAQLMTLLGVIAASAIIVILIENRD